MPRPVDPSRFHPVRWPSCRAADQEKTVASPFQKSTKTHISALTLAACAAALLAACGGGSSPDAATPPPVVPASLTLSGTAATGAALAQRPVEAKCASGTSAALASATTGVDGKFSVAIAGGALPCVLRVTAADGSVLHSLATGTGATAAANITPASELVLVHLAGGPAAGAFSSFDAASLADAKVQAALTAVGDTLKAAGVDVAGFGNLLTAPLVAAHGSTAGNDFDKALDALKAKLDANKISLAALADLVVKGSPNLPVANRSSTPSLPAAQLLQPAATNCAALRSGRYRLVVNAVGDANAPATEVVTIDASKLTATDAAGQVSQLTANGACRYRTPNNGDAVVSQAGVIVAQIDYGPQGAAFKGGVLFPEQTHPLASLAGDWNLLGLDRTADNGPVHLTAATGSLNATGQITAITQCDNGVDCVSVPAANLAKLMVTANAAGGFDFTSTNSTPVEVDRLFAYRSGGGELVWVLLSKHGHIQFATRKAALTLPDKGRVSEGFNLTLTPQYTAPFAISDSKNTIVSADATANAFLRDSVINLSTGVTRPERFAINQPREGYSRRTGESVVDSAGQPSTVQAFVAMTLRGTGVTPVAFLGSNQLVLSVNKP